MKLLFLLLLLFADISRSEAINLSWDASQSQNVSGYKLHYGNSAGQYSNVVDVGNVLAYTLSSPLPFYAAASSYSNTKYWSELSNSAVTSWTIDLPALISPAIGYKIYWGTSPGVYTNSQDIGGLLTYTITGLDPAITYYANASAYSLSGDIFPESVLSNEVSLLNISAFYWYNLTTTLSNNNKTLAPALIDSNITTDLSLPNTTTANRFQAIGALFQNPASLINVSFINGTWVDSGDGTFSSNIKLQFTNDGTNWTDSAWAVSPAYDYNSANSTGKTYMFTGSPITALGFRIIGELRIGGQVDSWWLNAREIMYSIQSTQPVINPPVNLHLVF